MIIKSLRVQNFRCILDATLHCDRLTAIVGRNGSGKSSFLHALNMFYDSNSRYSSEDFYAQNTNEDIIITVTFCELTPEEETLFEKEEIFDPSNIAELQSLSSTLSDTLRTFIPDASVELNWIYGENVEIPLPRADVKLVEDEYASSVGRTGHGLQRAFILTMLQHLALAQMPAGEPSTETAEEVSITNMPNLILGIEEPELYQYPNRQRHLSRILLLLAEGSIRGVAEKTKLIPLRVA